MTRILDTIPAFESFARKAGLESPLRRESLWRELYESQHPEVFAAFNPRFGSRGGVTVMARELSSTRDRVTNARPIMADAINRVDPELSAALGLAAEPDPVHVLMVGQLSTNAAVGRIGSDVAVFHCLEWFESAEGAPVLVAHEGAHAWHEIALGPDQALPVDDLAWMIFTEGLATLVSRHVVPDHPELDYFWYGHKAEEDWLDWCEGHHGELTKHLAASLDIAEATETFFGGGLVDGHWRVGYFLADRLVAGLGLSLPELVALTVDEARQAVRTALAS